MTKPASAAPIIANGYYTEFEYGLILKTAGAAAGNTFDFRLYNNTTAFTTYTQTPRVTVTVVDTEDDLLANDVASASSVGQPAVQQVHGILANDVASAVERHQPGSRRSPRRHRRQCPRPASDHGGLPGRPAGNDDGGLRRRVPSTMMMPRRRSSPPLPRRPMIPARA